MNSCIHCIGLKRDEMGQLKVQCEYSGEWSLAHGGTCFGSCEGQEYSREYIASMLNEVSESAYGWNIDGKVLGIPVNEFERLMDVAAEMVLKGSAG